jgi:TolB protein
VFSSVHDRHTFTLWRINTDGSDLTQITHGLRDVTPYCSSDGKWIAYVASEAGKPQTVWRVNIDGSNAHRLTDENSFFPAISPDGKLVAFIFGEWHGAVYHKHLSIVSADTGTRIHEFDVPSQLPGRLRFTPDGEAVAYTAIDTNGTANLWTQPLSGGSARQLTDFKSGLIFAFAWSPDGKRLAISRGQTTRDVILLTETNK